MRLRAEKNLERLQDAREWARIHKGNLDNYFDTKRSITDPVEKAEARVKFNETQVFYQKALKKIRKHGRLLSYTEKQIDEIVKEVKMGDFYGLTPPRVPTDFTTSDFS
jgi:membrane-bound lytic murein transglycosylase MltF|tara:strand:- start:2777 stop:3100 length:324 start_codon:yes stop_codon:yes gene_type:complete